MPIFDALRSEPDSSPEMPPSLITAPHRTVLQNLTWPSSPAEGSANHSVLCGPTVIDCEESPTVEPVIPCETGEIRPRVVISASEPPIVNHRLPLGPLTIDPGFPDRPGMPTVDTASTSLQSCNDAEHLLGWIR